MLLVDRHRGESVVITTASGEQVFVTVQNAGGRVRLSFQASREIQIDRMEVYMAKRRESREAKG